MGHGVIVQFLYAYVHVCVQLYMCTRFYVFTDTAVFPVGLLAYGLNEELLAQVFSQLGSDQEETLSWYVRGVPDHGFYQDLRSIKVSIGRFYVAIDKNLQTRGFCPDNTYRFIERLTLSKHPRTSVVRYGLVEPEVNTLQIQLKECSELAHKLITDLDTLKKDRDETQRQLDSVQRTLKDTKNEMKSVMKQFNTAQSFFPLQIMSVYPC